MQKYQLLKQGKDCALYVMKYADGTLKHIIKDKEGDVIIMCVGNPTEEQLNKLFEKVDTYDLEKIHAEKRAEHDKWVKEFVE